MKKEKRNRGLSSWNEKVALGLRKEKQLAFKATTHIHKNTENEEKNRSKCSASETHRNKKMKRFLLVCKGKLI